LKAHPRQNKFGGHNAPAKRAKLAGSSSTNAGFQYFLPVAGAFFWNKHAQNEISSAADREFPSSTFRLPRPARVNEANFFKMKTYIPPHAVCYYDASVSLGLDAKEFDARLAAIESKVAAASKGMSKSFGGVSLAGLAGLGIGAGIESVMNYAARIQDLSDQLGVSTDAIQHFGNAAEKNGSSLEAMGQGFRKLEVARSKALQGDQELIQAFQRLGISIFDLAKLKPEELMKKLGASSLDAADTVKLLGKNALELRPTLIGIADGTIKIGKAIDKIDIKKLKEADDLFKQLGENSRVIGATVIGSAGTAFEVFRDKVKSSAKAAGEAVGAFGAKCLYVRDVVKDLFSGNFQGAKEDTALFQGVDKRVAQASAAKAPGLKHSKAELEGGLDDLQKKMAARVGAAPLALQKGTPYVQPRREPSEDADKLAPGATVSQVAAFGLRESAETGEWNKRNRNMDETGSGFGDYGSGSKTDPSKYGAGFPNLGAGLAGMKDEGANALAKKGVDQGALFQKIDDVPAKLAKEMKNH
jgi:hypothetical protein